MTEDMLIHPSSWLFDDSFHLVENHLKKVFEDHFKHRRIRVLEVRWTARHVDILSGDSFRGGKAVQLNEQNTAAVVQLIMQRSGVDELVVILEEEPSSRGQRHKMTMRWRSILTTTIRPAIPRQKAPGSEGILRQREIKPLQTRQTRRWPTVGKETLQGGKAARGGLAHTYLSIF